MTKTQTQTTQKTAGGWDSDGAERPEGKAVATIFEGPLWLPQHTLLNDAERKRQVAKASDKNPRSASTTKIRGKLATIMAYGREVYALEVEEGLNVKMPEHTPLYAALNLVELGADVFVEFRGRGNSAKKGQQAPYLYDVVPADLSKVRKQPRPDALTIMRREEEKGDDGEDVPF